MSKITSFSKSNLAIAHIGLEALLAAYTKKTGIDVSVGNIQYDENQFRTRVTGKIIKSTTINEKTVSVDPMFALQVAAFNLKLSAKGKKLTGYNSRRPKYPFSYIVVKSGAKYKCTPSQAQDIFGK